MPKIYEYFGIVFFFYSNEHEPVHVHAQTGEFESKVEFEYKNGRVKKIVFLKVKGKKEMPIAKRKDVIKFIRKYHRGIVEKWMEFFVMNSKPKIEKITKRL